MDELEQETEIGKAHLRVARPTDDLNAMVTFYHEGLGFAVLARFQDHDGFDGVMLGHPEASYHLEFTHERGHAADHAPSEEHLLVFYLPNEADWKRAVQKMETHGYAPVPSHNPYWDKRGRMFADPDGYRVVLQNAAWD